MYSLKTYILKRFLSKVKKTIKIVNYYFFFYIKSFLKWLTLYFKSTRQWITYLKWGYRVAASEYNNGLFSFNLTQNTVFISHFLLFKLYSNISFFFYLYFFHNLNRFLFGSCFQVHIWFLKLNFLIKWWSNMQCLVRTVTRSKNSTP